MQFIQSYLCFVELIVAETFFKYFVNYDFNFLHAGFFERTHSGFAGIGKTYDNHLFFLRQIALIAELTFVNM